MESLGHDEEDGGTGSEEVVSFIDLPPNSLTKLPEKGILKKHGGYGIGDNGTISDVERTLNSLNGYHDDILEALRNAHRGLTNTPSGSTNLLDDEALRKSLVERGYAEESYRKDSDNQDNVENPEDVDEEDIPPTCGTIRIRTLEDIIRQLEHHSTRNMSPVDSEDIRISENENERHYRMDSSVCSESSQGSRRCSRSRDDDSRFVYGRYRQPTTRSPFGSHQHSRQLHEEEGIYETADPDRGSNPRGETPESESHAFIKAQQQLAQWTSDERIQHFKPQQPSLPTPTSFSSMPLNQRQLQNDQLRMKHRGYYPPLPLTENEVFSSDEVVNAISRRQGIVSGVREVNVNQMPTECPLDDNFSLDCKINNDLLKGVNTSHASDNENTALLPSSHFPEYKH